jgi:hypothetical protein
MKFERNPENGWLVASVPLPTHDDQGWWNCIAWCTEQWGDSWGGEAGWKYVSQGVFEFRRVDNLTLFLLRWA